MIVWICGLSGSGKSTIGRALHAKWRGAVSGTVLLDGDEIRAVLNLEANQDYGLIRRHEVTERIARIAQWLDKQNINVIVTNISVDPIQLLELRNRFRDYFEVFIDVPIEILVSRDDKGLYQPALRGERDNVVGVDIPYPGPLQPDLVINNASFATTPEAWAQYIAASAGIDLSGLRACPGTATPDPSTGESQ